jgi:glycine/D-amino acid oxidase-like deaminating enzyme
VTDFPPPGPGSTGIPSEEDAARLAGRIAELVPSLRPVIAGGWTGLRTFAPDRRPLLGADPELPGLWWVAGLGGYGITCAHAASEAVATWLSGAPTPWLRPAAVDPGRAHFGRWPIRPEGSVGGSRLVSGRLPQLG